MSNQRTTFLKRQRETDRKDKARAKEQRLAQARQQNANGTSSAAPKGPQIAWDEAVTEIDSAASTAPAPATEPTPSRSNDSAD